eukprot:scaffold360035_cov36-Prasinocladus_malaysianus.AAC.1
MGMVRLFRALVCNLCVCLRLGDQSVIYLDVLCCWSSDIHNIPGHGIVKRPHCLPVSRAV